MYGIVVVLYSILFVCNCLDNGLVLTPPMGWLAWTRFTCQIDCLRYTNECISEQLFTSMADVLVSEGYLEAGYNRVNVDDCWAEKHRGPDGNLVPDKSRFPSGIKWLAQYMHKRGLLLGLYLNYGQFTCMGYPGTEIKNMQMDASLMAEWGVDMLKFDGCFNDPNSLDDAYPIMGTALNRTGRNIVYSCSWPYYIRTKAMKKPNYKEIVKRCNLWRNFEDIQISWGSIQYIIDFYDTNQDELSAYHGPGHWNDPDMIIIGNPGLTVDQCKVQMALWAIWSAPLLMSNDLRDIQPAFKQILINKNVIAINQDPMGIMGKRITQKGAVGIYLKRVMPVDGDVYSYAIVFFNRNTQRAVKGFSGTFKDLGLTNERGYEVQELFTGKYIPKIVIPTWEYVIDIPTTGVVMYKATIAQGVTQGQVDTQDKSYWFMFVVIILIVIVVYCKCTRVYCRSIRRKIGI